AFWLPISQPVSVKPPVPSKPILKKEIPRELSSISLVKELLKHETDRLMELFISKDLVHTAVNSLVAINDYQSMEKSFMDEYEENLKLQTKIYKKNDMIENVVIMNFQNGVPDLKICAFLLKLNCNSKNRIVILQNQECVLAITLLSVELSKHCDMPRSCAAMLLRCSSEQLMTRSLKGKNIVESVQNVHNLNVVTSKVYKLDLPPFSPCIKNNMAAYVDYLKHTQANVDILHEIVKDARELRPLDSNLASAC
ncbi:hypothetical protein Tco_1442143, partial [Tanacetum coccineum]